MVAKRVSRSILEIRVPPSLFLSQKCDGTRHVIIITCCSSNKVKKVLAFAIIFYFMGYGLWVLEEENRLTTERS